MQIPKFLRAVEQLVVMLWLFTKASPKVASKVPQSIPIVVDLPAPFAPIDMRLCDEKLLNYISRMIHTVLSTIITEKTKDLS